MNYLLQLNKSWNEEQCQTICDIETLFKYDSICQEDLPPPNTGILLNPLLSVIPFPAYFLPLYNMLWENQQLEWKISKATINSTNDNVQLIKQCGKEKVKLMSRFIQQHLHSVGTEGIQLVLPYIAELITTPSTGVQAAMLLFNVLSQTLGYDLTSQIFVPLLIQLLDGEATPKHLKLYHRTFIVQLIVRLGIRCFLTHFATLLVEATAGYKNFVLSDFTTDEANVPGTEEQDVYEIQQALDQVSLYSRAEFNSDEQVYIICDE